MKFRKKPVVIEAMQYTGENGPEIIHWAHADMPSQLNDIVTERYGHSPQHRCLRIRTLEGIMEGYPTDWIVRGISGEFYPCKPDIFEKTYEPVED